MQVRGIGGTGEDRGGDDRPTSKQPTEPHPGWPPSAPLPTTNGRSNGSSLGFRTSAAASQCAARRTPGGQILYGHRKVYSSCRLLLLSRFFVSRLRGFVCLTRVLEGGRRVLLACCMIALSMVLRSHPMSLGGVLMMLSCFVMRVFWHVRSPLESIFQLSKPRASYEPLDVIVRSSLPGRMAHSAVTSPRVSLARNPTEPLEPPSIRLPGAWRVNYMRSSKPRQMPSFAISPGCPTFRPARKTTASRPPRPPDSSIALGNSPTRPPTRPPAKPWKISCLRATRSRRNWRKVTPA